MLYIVYDAGRSIYYTSLSSGLGMHSITIMECLWVQRGGNKGPIGWMLYCRLLWAVAVSAECAIYHAKCDVATFDR